MLAVAPILESEPDVELSLNCEVGVWFPHSSKRLSNQPYDVLNRAVLYLASAEGEVSCQVFSREGVEDRDRIPV